MNLFVQLVVVVNHILYLWHQIAISSQSCFVFMVSNTALVYRDMKYV